MRIEDIETPALIIDVDVMEKNLATLKEWVAGRRVALRSHFKTPKSPIIAWKEVRSGAIGLCAQKLGEAQVLADAGIQSILISNELVQPSKIERLAKMRKYSDLMVCVDNPTNVRAISEAVRRNNSPRIGTFVEIDVGQGRCGVAPGKPALELARRIVESPGLEFKGIMAYSGHLQMAEHTIGAERKKIESDRVCEMISLTRDTIEDGGVRVEIVTGAGTGTYRLQEKALTEIQPGSYVLMDWKYKVSAPEFDVALTILSTVMSKPSSDRAILDAGLKAVSTDGGQPIVKGVEGLEYHTSGDEHGILRLDKPSREVELGEKIELYPSHCDTTINLHDRYHVVRDGDVEAVWSIEARGKCQ